MRRLLYCCRCGEGQVVESTPEACRACGHGWFHRLHPRVRDAAWVWPGYTEADTRWLRSMRISTGDLPFEAKASELPGWWVVVDQHGEQAVFVICFGPPNPNPERAARTFAAQANRDALRGPAGASHHP